MHSNLITGSAAVLLLATAATAGAQTRATHHGPLHIPPLKAERTNLPKANRERVSSNVFTIGQRTTGRLYDADATVAPAKAPARILGDGTLIYGSMIYSDTWAGTTGNYGIYSFPAGSYTAPTLVAPQQYEANGGGCLVGDTYVYVDYIYTEEMGYTFATLCRYNLVTGELTTHINSFINDGFDQSQITHDLAYDPTTDRIFAISYTRKELVEGMLEKFVPAISEIDPYNGMVSPIAETPQLSAIAVSQSGELYGISSGRESTLYRINKNSGELTAIGKTGLNPDFVQSAVFDPVTDKLYWAACQANLTTGLYEVNLQTGEAQKITDFDNHEEYGGLYIPAPAISAGAPAAVQSITADFAGSTLTGTVTVTAPSRTYDDKALSGNVTLTLEIDGTQVASQSVAPGATMTYNATLTEGIHGFTATASNATGAGPRTGMSKYVGIDGPTAPADLTVTHNTDGSATISWTAPSAGRNDGYIDPSQLRYKVVRQPGNDVIASDITTTSFTDALNVPAANYYYEVTGYMQGREGATATSQTLPLGHGTTLPCRFGFDSKEEFDMFTVIDVQNKYEARYHWGAWMYADDFPAISDEAEKQCAVYGYHPEYAADDWLISPSFTVEQGKRYRLTYTMWTRGDKEKLAVTAGPLNDIAHQSVITAAKEYNHKDHQTFTQEFTASASGNYYVGFHITSPKKRYYLFIDDIMIDEVADSSAPAPVTDLTVTPGEQGALTATVAFTAPTKTVGGQNLASVGRIDIFRGNEQTVIKSFTSPAPGSRQTWTDTNARDGFNTYRVVAYSADGKAGEKAETTAFVGPDVPVPVTDLVLSDASGRPVLTWTAPTAGVNGGYIDPSQLRYAVVRNDGTIMSRSVEGTTFTDNTLDPAEKQYFVYYAVSPVSVAGTGDYTYSDHLVYGNPYAGNFFESFSDRAVQNDPWTLHRIKGQNQLWILLSVGSNPMCEPVDGDGGLAAFEASSGYQGDESRLISPKLDLASFDVPMLSFWFYHNPSDNAEYGEEPYLDRLTVELLTPDGQYLPVIADIMVDEPSLTEGWYQYSADLSDYKELGWGRISFHGIAQYAQDVHIDRVEVTNTQRRDVAVYSFSGPASIAAGKKGVFRATIVNNGVEDASGLSAVLLRDGVEVARQDNLTPLQSKKYGTVSFDVNALQSEIGNTYSYTLRVDFEGDDKPENNLSEPVSCTITEPQYPEVLGLDGAFDKETGALALSWGDADALRINDSFENYTAFSISDIDEYTLIDGDGANTYAFADMYFDNASEPMAFIVFNPVTLGITHYLPEYAPHSGNQVLASFAAVDFSTGRAVQNNDYLITPALHPGTKFVFWAKTANYEWGYESFEVMYSNSGLSTTSFRTLDAVGEVPSEWTRYEYTVPEGARYMAIHYNAADKFLFYVDDLQFTQKYEGNAFTLTGFRVFRDGVAIADLPASQHSFSETVEPSSKHNYHVCALYGEKQSAPSDKFYTDPSGVTDAAADGVRVVAGRGRITVDAPDARRITVTNAAGVVITANTAATLDVPVAPGAYVVTVGSRRYKLIVR